jgi:RNA polymerase sigma-70 factor (ECF subfamily)
MSSRSLALDTMTEGLDHDSTVRALLVEHLERSYNLARMLTNDRALAEEATHDAAVRAMRASRQLRDASAFEPWFRRILVNCCRDVLKQRGRLPAVAMAPQLRAWPDPAIQWVERTAMAQAISTLSAEHREVVVLRFYADLSVDAIALTLGVRAGTVKSRLHRALSQLRAEYDASDRLRQEPSR